MKSPAHSKANLCNADLSVFVLSGADLRGASLIRANLSGASLISANLSGASLISANLSGASLIRANLSGAFLPGADLSAADLSGVDLSEATLDAADLSGAKLFRANLSGANLTWADLSYASIRQTELKDAVIYGVDLSYATFEPTSPPAKSPIYGLTGLSSVDFGPGQHPGLVSVRAALQDAGLRESEREATYAIEKGKTRHALNGDIGDKVEGALRLVFFEWTTGYGLHYGRAILILLGLICVMTFVYMPIVSWPWATTTQSGIFRVWPSDFA